MIGATSEKTGPVPVLGAEAEGYEAAVKWINSHGGVDGHELKLIVHDNAGEAAKAVSDLRTFAQEGIKLVVGGAFGPDCAAEAPVSAEAEMIVFCGSTDNLPEPDTHMFGVGLGYSPTIEAAAKMIAKYSKKPAVFADKDKSGDDSAHEAPLQLKKQGLEPILIRTSPTESSFKAAIQNAISQGADGLWFTECTPAAISAVGDAKALGFKGKIYLENCLGSFEVAEALKQLAGNEQQIIIQVPSLLLPGKAPTEAEQKAIETFKEAVPGKPNLVVGSGWDAIWMIKKLLEQTKTLDVKTNVEALENNFGFTGVWHSGTFTTSDHRGAIAEGYAIPAAITSKGTFEALE
ncbi:MAG: ABC transporter substrate-binding protein [Actinobacteria bacterium]|nr:ABC transporter substrate-binding protein [Actinomycetota bacterium]